MGQDTCPPTFPNCRGSQEVVTVAGKEGCGLLPWAEALRHEADQRLPVEGVLPASW